MRTALMERKVVRAAPRLRPSASMEGVSSRPKVVLRPWFRGGSAGGMGLLFILWSGQFSARVRARGSLPKQCAVVAEGRQPIVGFDRDILPPALVVCATRHNPHETGQFPRATRWEGQAEGLVPSKGSSARNLAIVRTGCIARFSWFQRA